MTIAQVPEGETHAHRQQQGKGFVEQANPDCNADAKRHFPRRFKAAFAAEEQDEERHEQPEHLTCVSEEWAAKTIGAKKAEPGDGCNEPGSDVPA